MDEAVKEFRAGLAIIERYSASDPDNPRWQIDLVLALNKLALVGDEPRARFERALAILRKLDAGGTAAGQSEGLDRRRSRKGSQRCRSDAGGSSATAPALRLRCRRR